MKASSVAVIAFAFGGACVSSTKEVCGGSDAKFYDEGLIHHLSKADVPYRKMHGGGVCVDERHASRFRAAERELDKYFPQIAHLPKDACEERALVEWAQREKLRFDVRSTLDVHNRPSGSLFLLRAFTYEEMMSYRGKLDREAPMGAGCT